MALGDLNRDGNPDLAVVNLCGDDAQCNQRGTVSVLINRGDGTFAPKVDFPVGKSPSSAAIGDLDGDGKADLATANWCGDDVKCESGGTISVLINDGTCK